MKLFYKSVTTGFLLAFLLITQTVSAQWSSNTATNTPIEVYQPTSTQAYNQQTVSDGAGGTFITWMDSRSGNYDVYAQYLDASGVAQWTTNGVAVCTASDIQTYPNIITDGAGGIIITWLDKRNGNWDIYSQKLNAAGAAQWTANGVAISTESHNQGTLYGYGGENGMKMTTDGSGGAIIVWNDFRAANNFCSIYTQRINSAGTVQWTANGVALYTSSTNTNYPPNDMSILADGSGGAFILASENRTTDPDNHDLYAYRVNASGVSQWTASGVAICTATNNQTGQSMVTDGSGGFITTWIDGRINNYNNLQLYTQRVNASGAVQWTANGIALTGSLTNNTNRQNQHIVSDAANGAIISWDDNRNGTWDVYAQRINSAGAVQWTTNGVVVCGATGDQSSNNITTDGSSGAIVTWTDSRSGTHVYAQKINSAGAVQWTANGVQATSGNGEGAPVISTNSAGGAIVVFTENRYSIYVTSISAQNINANGTFGIPPVPPTITSFTPTSGVVGTSVTITGTGFNTTAANNIVYFGATKATVTGTPTATSITVTVPAGATYAPISLLNTTAVYSCVSSARFAPVFAPSKTNISVNDFATVVTTSIASPTGIYRAVSGDLDGDGKPDIAFANRNGSGITVMRNTSASGSVSFGTRQEFSTSYQEPMTVTLADVDGDGKLDLVVPCGNLNGAGLAVLLNNSSSGTISFAPSIGMSIDQGNASVADFDKDGKPDIVLTSGDRLAIYRNTSTGVGNFSLAAPVYTANGTMNNYVSSTHTIADIDGDGKLDIVSGNGNNMIVLLNTSTGTGNISFAAATSFATTSNVYRVVVGDFNGDGKMDVATSSSYSSANTKLSVFQNTSSVGSLSFTRSEYDSYDPGELMVADINGDGKVDIALSSLVFNTYNTALGVYQNTSSTGAVSFGARIAVGPVNSFSPYFASAFDIDGDGKPDVLTSNDNSYSVFRNLSVVNVWTGTSSTAWGTTTNWSAGTVPTSTDEVSIPSGTTYAPTFSAAPATIAGLGIASGATLTNSSILTVSGALTNAGTITGGTFNVAGNLTNTGTIINNVALNLNGSSAQTISGTGTIKNLTLNNNAGATISSGTTSITGTYTPTAGILTTNGLLTLVSNASGTANIAAGSSSGNYISGNVNVQRYVPGGGLASASPSKRAYRFISHPFSTSIAISQLKGTTGFDITGAGGSTNGFTTTASNNPSVFWYNTTAGNGNTTADPGWTAYTTATNSTNGNANAWNTYQGVRALVRGTQGQGLDGSTAYTVGSPTVALTGALNMGDKTVSLVNSGANWNLVGNPYPSAINLNLATRTNASNFIYVWKVDQGVRGAYSIAQNIGTTAYNLPAYSAFFIQSTGSTPSIAFHETDKTASVTSDVLFRNATVSNTLKMRLESADGSIFWDELNFNFNKDYKDTKEAEIDGLKMFNPDVSLYSITSDNEKLSVDGRSIKEDAIIPLGLATAQARSFRFIVTELNNAAVNEQSTVYLKDKYLNTLTKLETGTTYDFAVTANAASQGEQRFELVQKVSPALATNSNFTVKVSPNPATDVLNINYDGLNNTATTTIKIVDMNGKVMQTIEAGKVLLGNQTISVKGWSNGMYNVQLLNGDSKKTVTVIKQ